MTASHPLRTIHMMVYATPAKMRLQPAGALRPRIPVVYGTVSLD